MPTRPLPAEAIETLRQRLQTLPPRRAERGRGVRWHVQPLMGISEPMPLGVFMAVQVPAGTYFQALPW